MGNYLFSFTPTFTQGLVLGQLSILLLLAIILKYLFLDSGPPPPYIPLPYSTPSFDRDSVPSRTKHAANAKGAARDRDESESAEWFNLVLRQVVETYRSKLRNDISGPEGEEIARQRIERFANSLRPESFVDPIHVLSVDLGCSAPRISNARLSTRASHEADDVDRAEFDMTYTDTLSVSFTTSVLFHYPVPYFIRLPITLTVSLSLFSSTITLIPPDPRSQNPTLTISIPPTFTLNLNTTSLMGSRAKLADVPKLHEMIQAQVHRALAERGTWKIVMPWVANVDEVKQEASAHA